MSLRHLRHVPADSIATVINSLQSRVNSITLYISLNATTGKIFFETPDLRQSGTKVTHSLMLPLDNPVPQFDVSFLEKLPKIFATRGEI